MSAAAASPRRRLLLVVATGLALALTMSGCGSSTNTSGTSSEPSDGGVDQSAPADTTVPSDSLPEDSFTAESFGPDPTPVGIFRSGTATLKLSNGTSITLDELGPGAEVVPDAGSQAVWFNADGWYLSVQGPDLSVPAPSGSSPDPQDLMASVQLDRITGGHHWHAAGSDDCDSIVEKADGSGLRGSAACQKLQWTDQLLSGGGFDPDVTPAPVEGQSPFDVEITFDAH